MAKPICLDLFCGEGGAGQGYADAGFQVIGVDKDAHALRRYPFGRECMDWETGLKMWGETADLIHASPPCQRYSRSGVNQAKHPDLLPEVREALLDTCKPYVIENVPGAPLKDPVELCGCMWDLGAEHHGQRFSLYRPRLFEATFNIATLTHKPHEHPALPAYGHGSPGRMYRQGPSWNIPAAAIKAGMGTEWMTRDGTAQSIPPVFAEYVGRQFLEATRG